MSKRAKILVLVLGAGLVVIFVSAALSDPGGVLNYGPVNDGPFMESSK